MKKLWILLPLVLLLSLAACKPALQPGGSMPETQLTQSGPTETTVNPTVFNAVQPPYSELQIFIYEGKNPSPTGNPDVSGCKEGHLYYYHQKENAVSAICDEPVICFADDNIHLYFIKESAPTKLFCAPQTELSQQEVVYESNFGTINTIWTQELGAYANKMLVLTVGNKRGVLLDLVTGEATVVIEQYYIQDTSIEGLKEVDGKPSYNKIWFRGKLSENDRLADYFLWPNGSITKMEDE